MILSPLLQMSKAATGLKGESRNRPAMRRVLVATSIAILIAVAIAVLLPTAPSDIPAAPAWQPSGVYLTLAYLHFATIAPCFLIGIWVLLRRKGTPVHKLLGRIYVVLISFSSVVAAAMPAALGPRLWNHFGFIHLFCVVVFVSVPLAIWAIRRGNVRMHANTMLGMFFGGILIAGTFALMPGRLLHTWLFAGGWALP